MPRYRARSWRALDTGALAPDGSASAAGIARAVAGAAVGATPVRIARLAAGASVRILGIDPGSLRTGYGVIECGPGSSKSLVHGCLVVRGTALNDRLRRIFDGVQELIEQYRPHEVAVERVFVNRNADSALKLGHARGAALCAVPSALPVFEYTPRAIKLAIVGFGAAEKAQVAHMIRALLTLQGQLSADASDALAVAVCHAHSRQSHALAESAHDTSVARRVAVGRAR